MRSSSALGYVVFSAALALPLACATSSPRLDPAIGGTDLVHITGTLHVILADPGLSYTYLVSNGSLASTTGSSEKCSLPEAPAVTLSNVDHLCPCAATPDGELIAVGAIRRTERSSVPYDVAILNRSAPGAVIARIERSRAEYVSAIAWSPDGKLIALLSVRERMGKSPLALLAALSGHPVQRQDFRVEVYGREGRWIGSTQYVRGFVAAYGRLCWSAS